MSHGGPTLTKQDITEIVSADPFCVPRLAKVFLWILLVGGILVFGLGISGPSAKVVWMSFHVNMTYWICLAAAASCFSAVFQICNAQWVRPIRRLFESALPFFFYLLIPLIVLYVFRERHDLFTWISHPVKGRGSWLNPHFVYLRDIFLLFVLALLAKRIINLSLRRDIGALRSGMVPGADQEKLNRWADKYYDRFIEGWGKDATEEIAAATAKMGRLSPVIVIAYAIIMSLFAFDQIMSVDTHWYSTLFGAFVFMSGVYLAVSWVGIGIGLSREQHNLYRSKFKRSTLHDLGKLVFGFGIFWAYLFWSHYLPIWYGNIPEETVWVITRLRLEPWHSFAWLILGSCFIIPFLLGLSRDIKQIPALLLCTGAIVACGLWLQFYLLFVPTLYPKDIPLGFHDIAITFGFLAGFLLSSISFLEKVPLIPFGDTFGSTSSH